MSVGRLSLIASLVGGVLVFSHAALSYAKAKDANAQPFTVQDLVRLQRLSDVTASPDGKHLAYTVRTTDMEANRGRTAIWLLDTNKRNAVAVRLTDPIDGANSPQWSADGNSVYFLSSHGGASQVWRSDVRHIDAAHPATPVDSSAARRWLF